ncbi:hypothetical protein AS200_43820 [Streptomyces sp. CdTB01]|nr:hypothetical protein AS200_43820 [Streptomyces sp. CdTB01]
MSCRAGVIPGNDTRPAEKPGAAGGRRPSTRICQSDRIRVSRKNSPCGTSASMSPEVLERQNIDPSTGVMGLL